MIAGMGDHMNEHLGGTAGKYAVVTTGDLTFRVYDSRAMAWADQPHDANPTRKGAEERAFKIQAIDQMGRRLLPYVYLYKHDTEPDEDSGQVLPPFRCHGCGKYLEDEAAIVDGLVDSDPGDAENGPSGDGEPDTAYFHVTPCLAAWAARRGYTPDSLETWLRVSQDHGKLPSELTTEVSGT